MTQIDLVYFDGCAHADEARASLRRALEGTDLRWREWNQDASETPEAYRGLPSPTVLVDGRIVGGSEAGGGRACRVGGAPTAEMITQALAGRPPGDGGGG